MATKKIIKTCKQINLQNPSAYDSLTTTVSSSCITSIARMYQYYDYVSAIFISNV